MTYSVPPLVLGTRRPLRSPITRPFNIDPACVLALLPEINTTWIDYSNSGYSANRNGNPTVVPGRFHQAFHFNGLGDFLNIVNPLLLRFGTTDFSLVVWLKTTDTNDVDIIEKGAASKYYYLRVMATGEMRMVIRSDAVTVASVDSISTVNDGTWHQCVATIDRSDVAKIYIDGNYEVSADFSGLGTVTSTQPVRIGDDSLTGNFYLGDLDEILAFNRVLEAWEIKALYGIGAP